MEDIWGFVKFIVGKGDKIRFWEDIWVKNVALAHRFPLLYRVLNADNESITTVRNEEPFIRTGGFSWDLKFLRNLNERELEHISELIMMLHSIRFCSAVEDRRSWRIEGSKKFTCKSIFKKLCK